MKLKYALLMTAMFASFPGGASSAGDLKGGSFTLNVPKSSSADDTRGCPTLETPLRLKFIEDIVPRHADGYYFDAWRGVADSATPWREINSNGSTKHEVHVYMEFFTNPTYRFFNNDWQHVPELGQYVYKAVIDSWDKGQVKEIYLPGRDFKSVEVFHFQNNRPNWDQRNDYKKMVALMKSMDDFYDKGRVQGLGNGSALIEDKAQALFLYQKLSRANIKDKNINYYQFRGLLTPTVYKSGLISENFLLVGGQNAEASRYKPFDSGPNSPYQRGFTAIDSGTFDKALRIDSINTKIMDTTHTSTSQGLTNNMADYSRIDFKMSPENLKACGLE